MNAIHNTRHSESRCGRSHRTNLTSKALLEPLEARWLLNAPQMPSDLRTLTVSTTQIHLTWEDMSTNEDGFQVEYSTDPTFISNVTTYAAGQDTMSKWVTGLAANTTYYFHVRAVSIAEGSSAYTPGVEAKTASVGNVFNVTHYGAVPNDDVDDTDAVVAARNASSPGDVIYFPVGTYRINSRITTSGDGRVYKGDTVLRTNSSGVTVAQSESVLISPNNFPVFYFEGTGTPGTPGMYNVRFTGLTFRGWGLDLQRFVNPQNQFAVNRIVIEDCHFDVQHHQGISASTGIKNTLVVNNLFSTASGVGINFYGGSTDTHTTWEHLTIVNNEFKGNATGVHLAAQAPNSTALLVEQNYCTEIHGIGIEVQGYGIRTIVQDNHYENPALLPNEPDNRSTFAYSIVNDQAQSPITRRNYANAPTSADSPDGEGVRQMYELGGFNIDMYDNYSYGGGGGDPVAYPGSVIGATGTNATGIAHDNRILKFKNGPWPANGATVQFVNNGPGRTDRPGQPGGNYFEDGPDVQLTWSLDRPRPGPHRRVYGLALANGVLTVSGTKLADSVAITDDETHLTFSLNGEPFAYPLASIQTIKFEAQDTPNSPSGTIITRSLSIPSGVVLDLTNNSMIIDYTGSVGNLVNDVRQHLQAGRMVTTSGVSQQRGIGYGDNAELNKLEFAGQAVDSSSILIKFTYFGDANLDGKVDVEDLGALASNWQTYAPWTGGDFDYSGYVDVADLGLIASNWQAEESFSEAWYRLRHGGRAAPDSESESVEDAYESIADELGLSAEELAAILAVWGANAGGPVL